jgi:HD-GYP domain-containing protein (c-di-GMP phosphodiesterase class II)
MLLNQFTIAHPDTTLHPVRVKEYAKRLKRQYGWTEEDFIKASS